MTTREVLTNARALVAQGWTQGDWRDGSCYCAAGALRSVTRGMLGDAWVEAVAALKAAIGRHRFCGDREIIGWNDTPGRTQEEVIAAFDRAIAALKED